MPINTSKLKSTIISLLIFIGCIAFMFFVIGGLGNDKSVDYDIETCTLETGKYQASLIYINPYGNTQTDAVTIDVNGCEVAYIMFRSGKKLSFKGMIELDNHEQAAFEGTNGVKYKLTVKY